jgi:hypothetical protein
VSCLMTGALAWSVVGMSGSDVGEAISTSGVSLLPWVTSVWIHSRSGASKNGWFLVPSPHSWESLILSSLLTS